MYRVVVKSRGKYNDVVPGARYCFTKRSVIKLIIMFAQADCEFDVEKFTRSHSDIFIWSDFGVSEKIWDKVWKILEGEDKDA